MEDTRLPKCVMFGEMVGAGCVGGQEKQSVDGVFPGRPQSFRHQRRSLDDCSTGRGGMAQNGRTRGGTFHGEMDCCNAPRPSEHPPVKKYRCVIYVVANPVRGLLDRKRSKEHLQSSNQSKRKTQCNYINQNTGTPKQKQGTLYKKSRCKG